VGGVAHLRVRDVKVMERGFSLDPLSTLVDNRSALLQNIAQLGDFQPGSIGSSTRRKTVTQNLPSPAAIRKAESEVA
jgi:hypothetical protein